MQSHFVSLVKLTSHLRTFDFTFEVYSLHPYFLACTSALQNVFERYCQHVLFRGIV